MAEHAVIVAFGEEPNGEAVLVHWVYDHGARVRSGEIIAEAMADKVSFGIESPQDGYLVPLVAAGGVFRSGATLARVVDDPPDVMEESATLSLNTPSRPASAGFTPAPPAIRRRAQELGVDLTALIEKVKGRRLTRQDVEDWAQSHPQTLEPFSPFRQSLIHRLTDLESLPTTLHRRVNAGDPAISLLARMAWAVALALADHPRLHGWVSSAGFEPAARLLLGIAAETPQGLMVPMVTQQPEMASWIEALAALSAAVKVGKIDGLIGDRPSFVITNLGHMGIEYFTPRLLVPTVAILGVGQADAQSIPLSLTFDHRVVDGSEAAAFLITIDRRLNTLTRKA